jgi:hypothetical protein
MIVAHSSVRVGAKLSSSFGGRLPRSRVTLGVAAGEPVGLGEDNEREEEH